MRVDALMTSPVHTVRPEDTPKQVARFLVEHGWGCAPVVDEAGALIGIVTEADLMRLELHRDPTLHKQRDQLGWTDPPPATIGEIMTLKVFAVPVDYDVADAARLMIERYLTRLPVVACEQIVGIVSRTDLLRPLLRDDSAIARDAALRLADVPGPWTAQVDVGVLTLTGNGQRDTERLARTLVWGVSGVVGVQVRRSGPDAGGRRTETLTLSCGHRLTDCIVNHPLVLPGSSIRCSTCAVPGTVLRVESSPMISGSSGSEHTDTARRQKILIFDDGDGF